MSSAAFFALSFPDRPYMTRSFFIIPRLSEYVFPRFLNSDRAFCLPLGTRCVVTGRVALRRGASRPACLVLSSPVLSGPVRSRPVPSGPVRSRPVPSRPVPSRPVRSGPVRPGPFLFCPVLSCLVLSCLVFVLSCIVLFCPVRSGPIGFKGLRSVSRRYWVLFNS